MENLRVTQAFYLDNGDQKAKRFQVDRSFTFCEYLQKNIFYPFQNKSLHRWYDCFGDSSTRNVWSVQMFVFLSGQI